LYRTSYQIPDFLSYYYEKTKGPFLNLSDLAIEEAEMVLNDIRSNSHVYASLRHSDYVKTRFELEDKVRMKFVEKGGKPVRNRPHYMILGSCPWVKEWYHNGCEIMIPLKEFDSKIISFTYGDTFPAMRFQDGKPYRGKVYTLEELPEIIEKYGLPNEWNRDGKFGPERYIEAQIWDEKPIRP
jgi:hypothetical protein